uniref:Mediator of RNA polymerase II transcription subunit 13 n=1 Tax=Macrostomum lignano TaxID=282301 RepID=A0A1I8IDD1_9PLAT
MTFAGHGYLAKHCFLRSDLESELCPFCEYNNEDAQHFVTALFYQRPAALPRAKPSARPNLNKSSRLRFSASASRASGSLPFAPARFPLPAPEFAPLPALTLALGRAALGTSAGLSAALPAAFPAFAAFTAFPTFTALPALLLPSAAALPGATGAGMDLHFRPLISGLKCAACFRSQKLQRLSARGWSRLTDEAVSGNAGRNDQGQCTKALHASLKEIHYRRYRIAQPVESAHTCSDPVFSSFAKCQRCGILSAWKRYLPDTGDPSKPYDYGNYEKELWVFWHGGHDPPQLRDSLAHDLTPWSDSSDGGGISYEVRTMLFKAVHNCIERCLTGKGYVRLGQWFVRPLVPGLCLDPAVTQQFSLALNYFLHGESVCAAVDAKLYPPVHSLTKQQCQARTPVILSPHGIAGELTGREWDSQNQIESLVWREFFPHVRTDRGFVEVAVGQHRLWYPVDLLFATQAPLPPEPLSQIELNLAAESSADACLQHLLGCQGSDANGVHQQQQQQRCTCRRRTKPRPALTSAYHNRFFQATERTVDREPAMPTLSPQEPLSVEESEAAAAAASGAASIPTADGVGQQPSLKGLPKSEPISPPAAASVEAAKSQGDGVGLMDDESQQQQTQAAAASALAESSSSRPASVKTPQSQPTGSESQPASAAAAAAAPTPPLPPPPPPPPTSSAQQQQQQQPPPLPASSMPNGQASSVAADSLLEPGLGWLSVVQQSLRKRPLPQLEPWEADLNDSGHDVVSELPEWTSLAAYAKHARLLLPARGILNGPASSANATAAGSVGGSGAASGVALPIDDSASPSGIGSLVGLRSSPSKAGLSADSKSTAVSLKSEDILKVENLQMQSIFEVESPEPLDNANAACEGPGLHGNPSSSGCVIGGTSMASCGGSGTLPASDLCRIYPTPPSLENHIHPSPAPETDQANMLSPAAAAAGHHHHHHHASADCGSGPDLANDDDWSFLTSQRHQGGSLGQLFTAQNPPMPHLSIVYVPELPQTHRPHRAAAAAAGHAGGGHYGIGQQIAATPSSASVTAVGHMPAGTPVTPGSFAAVATPASVRTPGQAGTPCGSIVGEQLDQSQLSTGHQSIQASQAQPVEALRLNLLLSDSLLCLCRDQNFEACNICVCHGDLTGSEAGLYMPGLLDRRPSPCQCGFSASANRALGLGSNIFYEDLCDLLGDRRRLDYRPWPSTYSPAVIDSLLNFVSLTIPLRQFRSPPAQQQQSQSDATNSAVAVVAGAAAAAGAATADPAASSSLHPGHLAQFEDCNEAAKLVLQACTQGLHQPQQQQQPFSLAEQPTLLHRWSLTGQLPTAGSDLVRLLKSLRPWFQDSLWGKALQGNYWVTGPMTWQEFHQFARRGSEESCEPQPLPLISVYTDRDEGMLIAPTAVRDWERLGLEPYSRPKKLQFVVLAPVQASRVLKKAVRRTMSELTVAFADCKLGEHSPVALSTDGDFFLDTGRLESTELPPNCVVYMLVRGQTEACQLRDTVAKLTGGAVPVPLSTRLLLAPAKGDLRALALRVYTQLGERLLEWICDLPEPELNAGGLWPAGHGELLVSAAAGADRRGFRVLLRPPNPFPAALRLLGPVCRFAQLPVPGRSLCLRASLHLNQLASCDRAPLSAACDRSPTHPLNTYKTTEVLRYVLETCHSLSWLSVDPATGDRVSCLPRHINQLFLLYHSVH